MKLLKPIVIMVNLHLRRATLPKDYMVYFKPYVQLPTLFQQKEEGTMKNL